jgi:hypothetical protein
MKMKNKLFLVQVIGLAALMVFNSCKGKPNDPEQPYGEKSGIVTFKPMEMMGVKVTTVLYFDDYGKKEMRETTVVGNMMGQDMRQHSIDIRDGNIAYHYELENMSGGQDRMTKNAYKTSYTPEMFEQMNIASFSDKMKLKINYKDEGKETVAGIEGTKYSMNPDSTNPANHMTGVHFKNIPLKVTMGTIEVIADKVELGAKIPAEKFKVPEGYTLMDQPTEPMPELPADAPTEAPIDAEHK